MEDRVFPRNLGARVVRNEDKTLSVKLEDGREIPCQDFAYVHSAVADFQLNKIRNELRKGKLEEALKIYNFCANRGNAYPLRDDVVIYRVKIDGAENFGASRIYAYKKPKQPLSYPAPKTEHGKEQIIDRGMPALLDAIMGGTARIPRSETLKRISKKR